MCGSATASSTRAFRQSYGYDYVLDLECTRNWTQVDYGKDNDGRPVNGFDYFFSRGRFVRDVKKSSADLLPTWKLFLEHPAYDSALVLARGRDALNAVAVPTLTVGVYAGPEHPHAAQTPAITTPPRFGRRSRGGST